MDRAQFTTKLQHGKMLPPRNGRKRLPMKAKSYMLSETRSELAAGHGVRSSTERLTEARVMFSSR